MPNPRTALPRFVSVILGAYLIGVLIGSACRLLFYNAYAERMAGVSAAQLGLAFFTGWRFDTAVTGFILLPLLLMLPWVRLDNRRIRIITISYLTVFFSLATLILLSDIRFYTYFNSHLNFQAVQYLNEGRTVWHLITSEPMFFPFILAWLLFTVLLWWIIRRLYNWSSRGAVQPGLGIRAVWFLALAALTFLGIRGRTSLGPMTWGIAYISDNYTVNQLGLNGLYTLARAYGDEGRDPRLTNRKESERFPFTPFEQALDTVRVMVGQPHDRWLAPDKSLRRISAQPDAGFGFHPNIVIVLMESWSGRNTGCLGSPRPLTPYFDSLAAHGILFTQHYATGARTNYGLPGVLCSFPALPGRSVMKRYNARHPFRAISEILGERGYTSAFAYGGDLGFDNMEGFLRQLGFSEFFGLNEFGADKEFAKWGVPDHVVFDLMAAEIATLPRPFQLTLLTLSNHEPFDLPDSSVQRYGNEADSSKEYNAQLYADFAVGKFIEKFAKSPLFDSTIFVFTADHARFTPSEMILDPRDFHVPFLIYAPRLLGDSGATYDMRCSQVDILPTLMHLLGGEYEHESWGRNLFAVDTYDPGFASSSAADCLMWIEGEFFYLEWLGHISQIFKLSTYERHLIDLGFAHPERLARLGRRLHAYQQAAEQLSTPTVEKMAEK